MDVSECFAMAQEGWAKMRAAVYGLLSQEPRRPITNAEIGRTLAIYGGHIGHVGHISRAVLEDLKRDGLVEQDAGSKAWSVVSFRRVSDDELIEGERI